MNDGSDVIVEFLFVSFQIENLVILNGDVVGANLDVHFGEREDDREYVEGMLRKER